MDDEVEVVGEIESIETIATGSGVRARRLLDRAYGSGSWRKCKGVARVRLVDGYAGWAEVHWYEAHGRGRVDLKVKRLLSR
jgi:hypothetical protein